MSYELGRRTTRRAPKVAPPAPAKIYGKGYLPKGDKRMSETDTSGTDCGHVLNVSATERLRELLDGLQIQHFDYDKGGRTQTLWEAPDGKRHFTYETFNNPAKSTRLTIAWFPTPEQAIAATLGRGTCRVEENTDGYGWYCECGNFFPPSVPPHNFCPKCGREVVAE